jgi:rhodanese-related sulfurtransferase
MDEYQALVDNALEFVTELFPWELEEEIKTKSNIIILDIREQSEFDLMHIKNSIHVSRGLLESACVWNYNETIPILANSRNQNIVVVCRSGKRSALAAMTLKDMNYVNVRSLKLGIKGWNDNDLEMVNINGEIVDIEEADELLSIMVPNHKLEPKLSTKNKQ